MIEQRGYGQWFTHRTGHSIDARGLHLTPGALGPGVGYWIAPWARGHGYAAEAAHAIVAKKRDLGQVSSAEYLDAQRALTQARLNGNVTRFQALGALAEVEYAIGGTEP